jgi:flavin-dependent dehydrogenase
MRYDLGVIGAGVTGLAAAMYAARLNLRTIVLGSAGERSVRSTSGGPSWGREFHPDFGPDVVVLEHLAQLKQRGIVYIILGGMVADARVESTARFGMELGYTSRSSEMPPRRSVPTARTPPMKCHYGRSDH